MENLESIEPKILTVIKAIAKKKDLTVKEIIEKGADMTEAGFYLAIRKDTIRLATLRNIAKYLNVPINVFIEEGDELKLNTVTKQQDSSLSEFLKKENDFLRGFIKEKFAVNFNLGGLSSAFGDAYFFIGSTQKATHP